MSYSAKSSELRLLEGNRGHRAVPNTPKPQPLDKLPRVPRWLDDPVAKKEYKERGKKLFDLGLLNDVNLPLFIFYCKQFAKCVKEPTNANLQQLRMLMNDAGMTLGAQNKLDMPKPKKDDSKFGRFLNGQ